MMWSKAKVALFDFFSSKCFKRQGQVQILREAHHPSEPSKTRLRHVSPVSSRHLALMENERLFDGVKKVTTKKNPVIRKIPRLKTVKPSKNRR